MCISLFTRTDQLFILRQSRTKHFKTIVVWVSFFLADVGDKILSKFWLERNSELLYFTICNISWYKNIVIFYKHSKENHFADFSSSRVMARDRAKWSDLKTGVRESRRQFASLAVRVPTNFSFRKCLVGTQQQPVTRIYFLATAQVRILSLFWVTESHHFWW